MRTRTLFILLAVFIVVLFLVNMITGQLIASQVDRQLASELERQPDFAMDYRDVDVQPLFARLSLDQVELHDERTGRTYSAGRLSGSIGYGDILRMLAGGEGFAVDALQRLEVTADRFVLGLAGHQLLDAGQVNLHLETSVRRALESMQNGEGKPLPDGTYYLTIENLQFHPDDAMLDEYGGMAGIMGVDTRQLTLSHLRLETHRQEDRLEIRDSELHTPGFKVSFSSNLALAGQAGEEVRVEDGQLRFYDMNEESRNVIENLAVLLDIRLEQTDDSILVDLQQLQQLQDLDPNPSF